MHCNGETLKPSGMNTYGTVTSRQRSVLEKQLESWRGKHKKQCITWNMSNGTPKRNFSSWKNFSTVSVRLRRSPLYTRYALTQLNLLKSFKQVKSCPAYNLQQWRKQPADSIVFVDGFQGLLLWFLLFLFFFFYVWVMSSLPSPSFN